MTRKPVAESGASKGDAPGGDVRNHRVTTGRPCRYCGDPTHRAQDAVCVEDNS